MPAAANIALLDAQATPVSHTFVPLGPDATNPMKFWFEDQSAASPIGFWRLSVMLKRPAPAKANDNSGNRIYRAEIELTEPVLETVSNSTVSGIVPAPTISYVPRAYVQILIPERSALLDRKNIRKMIAGAINDTSITSVIESLQNFY